MKIWIYISIFILTVADALFTTLGVKMGYVEEANPFLQKAFHASPEAVAIMAVMFVTALLMLIYKFHNNVKWLNFALLPLFIVKVGVLALHFNWIIKVI
jgi:hypothetical protein